MDSLVPRWVVLDCPPPSSPSSAAGFGFLPSPLLLPRCTCILLSPTSPLQVCPASLLPYLFPLPHTSLLPLIC